MDTNGFETMNSFNQAALNTAKELEGLNMNLLDQLGRKNMELLNSAMEFNKKLVATVSHSADIQEVLNEQIKIASDYNGQVVTTFKEAADIVTDSRDDYQSWFEKGLKSATGTLSELAPKPRPASRKKTA